MTITKAEAALLGRRAERPVTAAGELLAIWVPGILRNPLNGLKHWRAEKRYRREWKERVALAILEATRGQNLVIEPSWKMRVTFNARTWGTMDSDGLPPALKPVRDALVECDVISGDAPKDGHVFEYEQRIDRARRGVEIRVCLK